MSPEAVTGPGQVWRLPRAPAGAPPQTGDTVMGAACPKPHGPPAFGHGLAGRSWPGPAVTAAPAPRVPSSPGPGPTRRDPLGDRAQERRGCLGQGRV